mgnify:CR=1 FL=1
MLPGVIGVMMATEAVKILLDIGNPLIGRLLVYDSLAMRFREFKVNRSQDWPVGQPHPTIEDLLPDYEAYADMNHSVEDAAD